MARKRSAAEVKAAKQKKIAIGGAVLLLVVLGIQVPRTLKLMKGSSAAPPVAVSTTGAADTTAAPAVPASGVAAPAATTPAAPATAPAELADSDPAPVAGPGQLVSFELFETKDPFAQQVDPNAVAAPPAAAPAPTADPAKVLVPTDPAAQGSGSVVPPGSTPAQTPPPTPSVAPAAATSISVNGAAEDVPVDGTFPVADPSFLLVSLGTDGKSVKIGVAGGSYADGKSTIRLTMGKPLTLQNTASGARYELRLLAVLGSTARPKS